MDTTLLPYYVLLGEGWELRLSTPQQTFLVPKKTLSEEGPEAAVYSSF